MKPSDLVGKKYGKLTVISRAENTSSGKTRWICKCDCGKVKSKPVAGYDLKNGKVRSCGCLYKESNRDHRNTTHGMTGTRLWRIWAGMKRRCKVDPNYQHVSVCDEWHDFDHFKDWAYSHGYNDHLTLDRIDNSGNYEPSNCRWATYKEQENNRSNNRRVIVNGVEKTLAQWADETGIAAATLGFRLKSGWPTEDLFIPVNLANKTIRKQYRRQEQSA